MDSDDIDTRTLVLLLAGHLRERVCSHPIGTLAGAATLGYMLGWSIPTPLYRAMASMAVRTIVMQVAGNLLGAFGSDEDDESELLHEDDELDLAGATTGNPHQVDMPPYVA
jgi:hypothetical protein